MVECPKCKEEFEALCYNSKVDVWQYFRVIEKNTPDYDGIEDYGNHTNESWRCPNCDAELATNEEDAIKVLTPRGDEGHIGEQAGGI